MSGLRLVHLKDGIVYGPVASRRLGRSLGINILGAGRKICNFDCVYCQLRQPRAYPVVYGDRADACRHHCEACAYVQPFPLQPTETHDLPSVEAVLDAVREALGLYPELDSLTLSGNGEPTVHPHFLSLVRGLVDLRDAYCPRAAITVLSNSATLWRPSVRAGLRLADRRVMKLDAGDEANMRRVNRPCPGTAWAAVVEGLWSQGEVTLQTLFIAGERGNAGSAQVATWYEALARVKPREVQVYSLDRVPADGTVERVPRERLEEIARGAAERTGAMVSVY